MMYNDDAELERALFALPLEEPPSDLRASILSATIYRPAPPFSAWEATLVGALAAVLMWLIALIAMGGAPLFVQTLSTIATAIERPFLNVTTLAWLGAGIAAAFWLSFFTGSQPFAPAVRRVEQQPGR
jgi:hypothetical protein